MPTPQQAINNLLRYGAARIAMSCEQAGLRTLAKHERRAAPVGDTLETRRSIGKRITLKAPAAGRLEGKTGINVGKRTAKTGKRSPHAHLQAGTKRRTRKNIGGKFSFILRPTRAQLSTGEMPTNDFIAHAATAATSAVNAAMTTAGTKAILRETQKLTR